MSPKVSIIIPCFKVENYLDRCIESVTKQTLSDIEIILVDDYSPDRVPSMCDEWAEKDYRIKVIHKEKNEGLGFARNTGMQYATGEFVAFVDSDDFIDERMYEKLYSFAIDNDLDTVLCNCTFYKDASAFEVRYDVNEDIIWNDRIAIDAFLLDMIAPIPEYPHDVKYMMSVWHGIYKRQVIAEHKVSFLSEREYVSEDILFDLDYYPHVKSIGFVKDSFYYYCYNGSSLSRTYTKEKYEKFKIFLSKVEEKLSDLFALSDYGLRSDRLKFLYLRTLLKQTVINPNFGLTINDILSDGYWKEMMQTYPYKRMDIKHKILFFMMKYKLSFFIKILLCCDK